MNQILKPRVLWAHVVKNVGGSKSKHGKVVLHGICSGCQRTLQRNLASVFTTLDPDNAPIEDVHGQSDVSLDHCVKLSRQGCDEDQNSVKRDPGGATGHEVKPQQPKRRRPSDEMTREWVKPKGFDTGIRLHNTLSRKKEPLILPLGKVATW